MNTSPAIQVQQVVRRLPTGGITYSGEQLVGQPVVGLEERQRMRP
tara:strand:+ start:519 stop:653 length:135 start_codon:yes stop_codon:yes gene_type:complete